MLMDGATLVFLAAQEATAALTTIAQDIAAPTVADLSVKHPFIS